jgi:hypothetical protein
VSVTTVVAVKTSDSRPSGQRRHQQHRVGEVHIVMSDFEREKTLYKMKIQIK